MEKSKRKKNYVDPKVQGELARRLVMHWLSFTVVAGFLAVGLEWLSDPFQAPADIVVEASWTYGPFLMVLLCLVPVFVCDAYKLSNRFAGPMVRIRQVSRALANGELPQPVEIRDKDFWQEVAGDINRVIARLAEAQRTGDSVQQSTSCSIDAAEEVLAVAAEGSAN